MTRYVEAIVIAPEENEEITETMYYEEDYDVVIIIAPDYSMN